MPDPGAGVSALAVPALIVPGRSVDGVRMPERERGQTAPGTQPLHHVQPDPPAATKPAENATYDGQPRESAGGRQMRLLPALLRAGHARPYGGLSARRATL